MAQIEHIHFKVRKWDYNPNTPLTNTKTEAILRTHPLRKNQGGAAEGITFIWILVLTGEGLEILYYSTEEFVLIPHRKISLTALDKVVRKTYDNTMIELAGRNLAVGLDAGFPPFDNINGVELEGIRQVMNM